MAMSSQEKIIRDPVHDVIAFRLNQPGEALLFRLINTREFQRLRRVRQLGLASLCYPGADHSRYSHSLGVMETARRMLDQLQRAHLIDPDRRTVCLVAALLHDLGHGPFSHVFEGVSGVHHETLTRRVILDPDSEVHAALISYDPQLPSEVVAMLNPDGKRDYFHDILSSQLDADRFDYLLRDNLMTGSGYGDFDLEWLLHALVIDDATDRLVVVQKGMSAVEAYLQARYHMYRNVYFHKVVRSAEGMVKLALQRARRLAVQGRLAWPREEAAVHKALLGLQLTSEDFLDLDEVAVLQCFKVWRDGDDPVLAELCDGLLYRKLFKSIDLTHVDDGDEIARIRKDVESRVSEAGGEPAYSIFYDEPSDSPYETYQSDGIQVRAGDGGLVAFGELSPISQMLNRQLMFKRLHLNARFRV